MILTKAETIAAINNMYPNRIIFYISHYNTTLYTSIQYHANRSHQSVKEWLTENGYTYQDKRVGLQSFKFDSQTARMLIFDFSVTQEELALWIGVTRTVISSCLQERCKQKDEISWLSSLTLSEEAYIGDMVKDRKHSASYHGTEYIIRNNKNRKLIIIARGIDKLRVITNISSSLLSLLQQHYYDVLDKEDQGVKRIIPVIVSGTKRAGQIQTNFMKSYIENKSRMYNISLEEYARMMGLDEFCYELDKVRGNGWIPKIEHYQTKPGIIEMHFDHPDYLLFAQEAISCGMTTKRWLKFHGFTCKLNSRNVLPHSPRQREERKQKYQEKKRLIQALISPYS